METDVSSVPTFLFYHDAQCTWCFYTASLLELNI